MLMAQQDDDDDLLPNSIATKHCNQIYEYVAFQELIYPLYLCNFSFLKQIFEKSFLSGSIYL